MKRFYCTLCKKVKRVRHIPLNVDTPVAVIPSERVGQCDWHSMGRASLKSNPKSRVAVIKSTTKKRAS